MLTFQQSKALARSELDARTDRVSGLGNRRVLDAALGRMLADASPNQQVGATILAIDDLAELNGTLGESTNIYDPDRPLSWSLGVLRRQWEFLYTRGGHRMREGHRPMTILTMLRSLWKHYTTRRGSSVAD